ncbi:glycosyltransferase family 9 protein [Gangjinia marincola]|uniref:Glycosyltransferase family 9 protein n=2 Tax=Gangjinia marincola TaxID=578463 RepID=A0ABN1MGD3_9FLAO
MIGDVLTSSSLCTYIKNKDQSSIVHYLINESTKDVVLHHPDIDKLILLKKNKESSIPYLVKIGLLLRKEKYDVVFDVYAKLSSNLISLLTNADIKIGYKKSYSSFIYHRTISRTKDHLALEANTALKDREKLLRAYFNEKSIELPKPTIFLTEVEKNDAGKLLEEAGLNSTNPILMIAVLGSSDAKTYPLDYMAHILDHLHETLPKAQIIFNYIPNQLEQVNQLYYACKTSTQNAVIRDVYGKSIREFLALLSHCDALIGNEGGAVNMAKALEVPTFSIFSPQISKEAWSLFENEQNYAIHVNDVLSAEEKRRLTNNELYSNFTPQRIIPLLNKFIALNLT